MAPIRCWTIKVWCKEPQPFRKAGVKVVYQHRELRKKPILWGRYGFFLCPKEAHKPMQWLRSLGFTKVELEEC
jgi:hypothetical protein